MTSKDLEAVLDANDADGCIALFASSTEAERRALAKSAVARLKKVIAGVPREWTNHVFRNREHPAPKQHPEVTQHRRGLRAAQIAVLASATIGEVSRFKARCMPPIDDAVAVLLTRRPPWVGEWAEMILSWEGPTGDVDLGSHWVFIRRLVREGLCSRPRGSRYIHGMLEGIRHRIHSQLLRDPALLDEEVWEIFESEPIPGMPEPFFNAAWVDPQCCWELVLARLAGAGRLSRPRLLDASLGGLERDYHENRAKWFALVHEMLKPTLDERAGRYLSLTASRNASTVTFALAALTALDRAERLEPHQLVAAIGPALLARTQGTVRSALKLIDRAARRDAGQRARAAAVAVEALGHESPAVQAAALDLVERHGDRNNRLLADLLRARLDMIAASQRERLASWLGDQSACLESEMPQSELDALRARALALDPRLAELAGVTVAIEVLDQRGGEVAGIEFSETDFPRLDPNRSIVPVADLDELIALFSATLENPKNPNDLERVLDGVSRLCDHVPPDFVARTGPLRAQVERPDRVSSNLMQPLCGLALAWIIGRVLHVQYAELPGSVVGFFARRVLAIARRAAERQPAPLLSAPTHLGGWIDPRELVERVRFWATVRVEPNRLDESLALSRLAPDRIARTEALHRAANLGGPFAAALRHALGGDGETVGADAGIWVAAARARAPREDDAAVEARHPGLGPDAGLAARCSLKPGPHSFADSHVRANQQLVVRLPPLPLANPHDLPTVLLHDRHALHGEGFWAATIWPLGRDSLFATAADWLLGLECSPYEARFYRPYLELLLDPDVPLRPMGRLLLAGALSANTAELQGLATDALVAAVDDGRVDGRLLGEAIHRLLAEGLVMPVRLTKALGNAARVSPLHACVVARAVELGVVGLPSPPRDLHALFELLKELLVETGEGLSDAGTESYLRGLKVSGKTAKLKRDLLSVVRRSDPSNRLAAAAQALAGRVERAERWMRCRDLHPV
jgi:Family of unknown function (DUF6493)